VRSQLQTKLTCIVTLSRKNSTYFNDKQTVGRSEERAEVILKMHKKGYSLEQIKDVTEMSEVEISGLFCRNKRPVIV